MLSEQFGAEYLQCRRLGEKLDFDYLTNLRVVFGKMEGAQECHRSLLIQSLQDVKAQFDRLDLGTMPGIAAVFDAIKAVNDIYADPRLQRSHAQGLFAAFLFWQLHPRASEGQRQQFANWVLRTHQYELRSINTADLIKIFEKIAQARRRQIFISMWFDPSTKANYEAIEAAVADLNAAHQLDIKLRPIRVDQFDTGYSYEINQEVLDLIESSGLMIADLSGGNRNVHHEIGYARLYRCREVMLLYPHHGGLGSSALDDGYAIMEGNERLRIASVDLVPDKGAVQQQLAGLIAPVVQAWG